MSDQPIEIETTSHPTATVIWLHGLGADGNDFVPIIPELQLENDPGIRFVFPNAFHQPVTCNGGYVMRSWYDIYSLDGFDKEDKNGIIESQKIIESLIQGEINRGIKSNRIVLMGFSQGGAIALHTGLRYSQQLAGIGALSTYLPLREDVKKERSIMNKDISIFMAHGLFDPVVRYEHGKASCKLLQQLGYTVEWKNYSMEHAVCPEEIRDISRWLSGCL